MDILRPSEEVMAQMTDSQRRLVELVLKNANSSPSPEDPPDILRQGERELGRRMVLHAAIVDTVATEDRPASSEGNLIYSAGILLRQGVIDFDVENIDFDTTSGEFLRYVDGEPQFSVNNSVIRIAPGDPTLDVEIDRFFETYELN